MPKIKITKAEKAEYKDYLFSEGFFNAVKIFLIHIFYIIKNYIKLSKEEKSRTFICIYYNHVDIPILTIRFE